MSFQGHCSLPLWWEMMALNQFHLITPPTPGQASFCFGRAPERSDLAWTKRGDLQHGLDYPGALFLWDSWKAILCPFAKGTGMVGQATLGCNITGRLREASCSLEPLILEWNLVMTYHGLLSSLAAGAGNDSWWVFSSKMYPSEIDFSF